MIDLDDLRYWIGRAYMPEIIGPAADEIESLRARVAQIEADAREQSEVVASATRSARNADQRLAYALRREANKTAAFDEASDRAQAEIENLKAKIEKVREYLTAAILDIDAETKHGNDSKVQRAVSLVMVGVPVDAIEVLAILNSASDPDRQGHDD